MSVASGRSSAVALVLANLIPVFGVLFAGWDVFSLLLLFWLENVYIGLFNVVRIATAAGGAGSRGRVFTTLFFLLHYGGFTVGHGFMLLTVFGPEAVRERGTDPAFLLGLLDGGLWLASAVLFVSHLFSLVVNYFLGGEYRHLTTRQAMGAPYARVVLLHVALLLGGFLLQMFAEPLFGLLILVAMKIVMDLGMHRREHQRLATRGAQAG